MERLIYSSCRHDDTNGTGFSPDFAAIGAFAAKRNAARGITGFLICTPTWFTQILEGETPALDKLYKALLKDKRHFALQVLSRQPCEEAQFPGWGMGWRHHTIANRILFLEHNLVQDHAPQPHQAAAVLGVASLLAQEPQDGHDGRRSAGDHMTG